MFYPKLELNAILKKLQGTNPEPLSLERGLRQASANAGKFITLEEFQYLVDQAKEKINAVDDGKRKRTALHFAVEKENIEYVQSLLKAGAKSDIQDAAQKNSRPAYNKC